MEDWYGATAQPTGQQPAVKLVKLLPASSDMHMYAASMGKSMPSEEAMMRATAIPTIYPAQDAYCCHHFFVAAPIVTLSSTERP